MRRMTSIAPANRKAESGRLQSVHRASERAGLAMMPEQGANIGPLRTTLCIHSSGINQAEQAVFPRNPQSLSRFD
jgi:hypothetical protein